MVLFDPDFLKLSDGKMSKSIDLSYFSRKGGIQPDSYELDTYVNGNFMRHSVIKFVPSKSNIGSVIPLFTISDYNFLGIMAPVNYTKDTTVVWPGKVDLNKMRYDITVPQNKLIYSNYFRTPPSVWNKGIPALMLQYNYSGIHKKSKEYIYDSNFIRLNSSLNVSGWMLRNESSWMKNKDINEFNNLRTYINKEYDFWQGGNFSLGQVSTDGRFFDSFSFTGIKFQSEDGMLKNYFSQFAPIIKGIATSQSRVTIRQGGNVIFQENVPPGEFEFRDINTLGSGDLDVEIRGDDGVVRHFTQTVASVPVLQREGRVRYSVSMGKYRGSNNSTDDNKPEFLQSSLAAGLSYDITAYGGFLFSDKYQAGMLGVGKYFPFLGALSGDITFSKYEVNGLMNRGHSYSVAFSKELESTQTTLNIESVIRSSKNYSTFTDSLTLNDYKTRSKSQINLIQSMFNYGQLSFTGSYDDYWDGNSGITFMGSYSLPFKYISFNVSTGFRKYTNSSSDEKLVLMNISIPLSSFTAAQSLSLNTSTRFSGRESSTSVGMSGRTGQLSFSAMKDVGTREKSIGANLSYDTNFSSLNGGITSGKNNKSIYYGAQGGIAIHPYGVTLARNISFSSGNALVRTPGVSSIGIKNGNIETDYFGNAIVSNLISYQRNQLALDVDSLPQNVDVNETDKTIIPVSGALVPVQFDANVGNRAIFTILTPGKSLPLGTHVYVLKKDGKRIEGFLDENNQVYLSGLPDKGRINLSTGSSSDVFTCTANFELSKREAGVSTKELLCH